MGTRRKGNDSNGIIDAVLVIIGILIFIVILVLFITKFIPIVNEFGGNSILILLFIIGVVGLSFLKLVYSVWKKIATFQYKEESISQFIRKIDSNLVYASNTGLDKELISNTGLLPMNNCRISGEDLLEGKFEGICYRSADEHITFEKGSGNNSQTVTVFRGRWIVVDVEERGSFELLIKTDSWAHQSTDLEKIETESILFDDLFDCYTNDNLMARRLLKPQVIEKLIEFLDQYEKKVAICYRKGTISIAYYDGKDHFLLGQDKYAIEGLIDFERKLIKHVLAIIGVEPKIIETPTYQIFKD